MLVPLMCMVPFLCRLELAADYLLLLLPIYYQHSRYDKEEMNQSHFREECMMLMAASCYMKVLLCGIHYLLGFEIGGYQRYKEKKIG